MLGRASLIAHETAHMWFGDLVTMRWFNDVWMKEVFANFMAAKIVNPAFPKVNHELRFLTAHYPAAYAVDRTQGTHPIRQELDNLNEAGSLYGADHLPEGARSSCGSSSGCLAPTTLRDGLRVYLEAVRIRQRDLAGSRDACSTSEPIAIWRRGAASGWKRRAGRWFEPNGRPIRRGADRSPSSSAIRRAGRSLLWTEQMEVLLGTPADARILPLELKASEPRCQTHWRRPLSSSCCRPAAASPTAASCSTIAAGLFLLAHVEELERCRRARGHVDHVVGRAAERTRGSVGVSRRRTARAAARGHRAERPARDLLCGRRLLALSRERGTPPLRAAAGADAARRHRARVLIQPESPPTSPRSARL